ncbi:MULTISPECIES: hypothetical protein [unclassified Simplicispira]|uniref:hypothetical protein n=1 Tax=unclassified Simplicispira TaxID=2630407 RepID=UPI000D5D6BDD|nr:MULTISPECIES: hypothetical protein [unclassified Simplicispira]PVY56779.1 hypothetical protein C8D04_2044 [Simplicispira sp. 125]REG17724.1 hypothetical protein C8D01_2354 [Simplicispira sp. 110]
MTDKRQPEPLRIAALLEKTGAQGSLRDEAASELRRLHAENDALRTGYEAARLEIESLKARPAGAPQPSPVAQGCALDVVLDAFENKTRGIPQAHIAAALVAELRAAIEAASTTPTAQGDALDTMRLDWLDADGNRCVFHLGKSWYTRPSYGLPYRKRASLREAIDAAHAAQEDK